MDWDREDADYLTAELQAAGRRIDRARARFGKLFAAGQLAEAAACCPHGWRYPLTSMAAVHHSDPRVGSDGWRCLDCGSALQVESSCGRYLSGMIAPCENEGEWHPRGGA